MKLLCCIFTNERPHFCAFILHDFHVQHLLCCEITAFDWTACPCNCLEVRLSGVNDHATVTYTQSRSKPHLKRPSAPRRHTQTNTKRHTVKKSLRAKVYHLLPCAHGHKPRFWSHHAASASDQKPRARQLHAMQTRSTPHTAHSRASRGRARALSSWSRQRGGGGGDGSDGGYIARNGSDAVWRRWNLCIRLTGSGMGWAGPPSYGAQLSMGGPLILYNVRKLVDSPGHARTQRNARKRGHGSLTNTTRSNNQNNI